MSFRQRTGSMLCPGCGQLVGVNDEACYNCGRKRPGMFGFASSLGSLKLDDLFVPFVMWTCGALYLATLVSGGIDNEGGGSGFMGLLAPSRESTFLFGASGVVPVVGYGRWWTPLSAGWLHGGLVHIGFNMMAVRNLAPLVGHVYGTARMMIIYTIASVVGFIASTLAGLFLFGVPWIGGGAMTVGASASIFGLIGALFHYGRRGGSSVIAQATKGWILSGVLIGLLPVVDNWAHLGGFLGGYLAARWLDPLLPERADHLFVAILCLVLSAAAVIASVITGRGYFA